MGLKIGLVGATGLVGETFLQILGEEKFPLEELRPFASEQSLGKTVELAGKDWPIQVLSKEALENLDVVFFSSGDEISKQWGPVAAAKGAKVIDNSAAFRMDPDKLLCVPEINGDKVSTPGKGEIIANPNCSTIQLVVALNPLAKAFGLEDVRVATYQSVSGAGREGLDELINQTKAHLDGEDLPEPRSFPYTMSFNALPQIGGIDEDGYCSEENKITQETKKILDLPDLKISAFAVRVPTLNSHSEAVWVTFKEDPTRDQVLETLKNAPGIKLLSGLNEYPNKWEAHDTNLVHVGKVRKDRNLERTWQFWVVADNLRKGAAYNGFQIAQSIF